MPDLLFELFSEEIPARMQAKAAEDLRRMVTDKLVAEGLVYDGAKAFATPRRLTLTVHGIPARQPDLKTERKGPKIGAAEAAVQGFLKATGLASLDEAGVRFVVVGGLAVVIQGFARLTADVDLVIDLDRENILRTVDTLTARGLRPLLPVSPHDFADAAKRQDWIETRNLQVFSMRDERNPLLTVDLFAEVPIPFEDLFSRADVVTLGGRPIRIASIEDLIRMKQTAGRPQDVVDVERLREIARRRHAR